MATKWNSSIQFPTDSCFVNRITEVTFGPSNSGNVMVTLSTEVHAPQEYEIGGNIVNIGGVAAKNYYVTTAFYKDGEKKGQLDEEKTRKSRQRFITLLSNLGIDTGLGLDLDMQDTDSVDVSKSNLNWDNLTPDLQQLKGKLVLTMMSPDEEERTKTPTQSQIDAGRKQGLKLKDIKGDVMKNPRTGKTMYNYWPKVREIFGLAPQQDGTSVSY